MKVGREDDSMQRPQRRRINSKLDGLFMDEDFEVVHKFEPLAFIQLLHETFELRHHNIPQKIQRDLSLTMSCLVDAEIDEKIKIE